jgi:hypothetical protein
MQTVGTALLGVKRCSLMRVRMAAQDGRRARRLLYLAAVRNEVASKNAVKSLLGSVLLPQDHLGRDPLLKGCFTLGPGLLVHRSQLVCAARG